MSKMWEVDPETRSKLQEIQKTNENNRCVDCGAPSPQWISPKFGIFFCLACSGIHRSLGVHISFVRSATMDALKTAEVKRMELGGNKPWKDFFNAHSSNTLIARDFDSCTISERYDSEAGEEWKERLTAKVEGTEYVPGAPKPRSTTTTTSKPKQTGITPSPSGRNTPTTSSQRQSAPQRTTSPSQKTQNEAYFAKMGAENNLRPDDLPPSQGGKYGGFGSAPPDTSHSSSSNIPSTDDFQRDPMAALTKSFGWLSSTVTKQATSVHKSYIQPGMKSFAEGDIAAQIRQTGIQLGNSVQQGTRGLGDQFNRFVEGGENYSQNHQGGQQGRGGGVAPEKKDFWDSFGADPAGPPKEKKDFWDDFAAAGEVASQQKAASNGPGKPSSIGTSAMKNSKPPASAGKKDDDQWGDW